MDITAALTAAGTQANLAVTASALIGVSLVVYGLRKVIKMMGGA
jgi:hypothetical protein